MCGDFLMKRTIHRPDPAVSVDTEAFDHSRRLETLIQNEAAAEGGRLPFDRFMDLALYAHGLGNYSAGARKFGPGGDFVTAPEISPLFGRCLAVQCIEALSVLGGGDILELGAGSGTLAAEILETLADRDALPLHYLILEVSPDLRERQREMLIQRVPELMDRIQWLDGLPAAFVGVVLANEVLDAMPVHRFRVTEDGAIAEIFVRAAETGFMEYSAQPVSAGLVAAVEELHCAGLAAEPGYCSEINLRLAPWLQAIGDSMARGLVLLIDYGYPCRELYQPDRSMGSLMCYYRHQSNDDPYRNVGLQDITAHVDFTRVATAGVETGFDLAGYTTQAHFLLGCGLDALMAEVGPDLDLVLGAKQLLLPSAMGERFKVIGLQTGVAQAWCGFSVRDLRDRL